MLKIRMDKSEVSRFEIQVFVYDSDSREGLFERENDKCLISGH